jgi:hypothetical protein
MDHPSRPNRWWPHVPRLIVATALFLGLGACAAVDTFGPRALDYNQEAADSYNSQILLNIIRAAYAEPLQFTDLSTVTGQASGSITTSSSLPFFGNRATSSRLYTLSPGFTVSGGPSFNVANLHNQDFYQGIEGPVKNQTIAQFLDAGYSPLVVLPIFISELSIKADDYSSPVVFVNSADISDDFNSSYSAFFQLAGQGLDMEEVKSTTPVGPPLTSAQAADPKLLASLVAGSAASSSSGDTSSGSGLTLKKYDITDAKNPDPNKLSTAEIKTLKSNIYYRLIKSGSSTYRFCFTKYPKSAYARGDVRKPIPVPKAVTIRLTASEAISIDTTTLVCGDKSAPSATSALEIKTRSVEEIFQFLGKMGRIELGLGGAPPNLLTVPVRDQSGNPLGSFDLFKVTKGQPAGHDIAATLDGETYVVRPDAMGKDYSSNVIQLLSDLLALYSSAKNLPAPSVIPFVTTSP